MCVSSLAWAVSTEHKHINIFDFVKRISIETHRVNGDNNNESTARDNRFSALEFVLQSSVIVIKSNDFYDCILRCIVFILRSDSSRLALLVFYASFWTRSTRRTP